MCTMLYRYESCYCYFHSTQNCLAAGASCNVAMPGCTPPTAFTKYMAPPPPTAAPVFVASSRQGGAGALSSGIIALIVVVVICALLLLAAGVAAALWRSRRASSSSSSSSVHDQPLATTATMTPVVTQRVDNDDFVLQPSYGAAALASSEAFAFPTTPIDSATRNTSAVRGSSNGNDTLPFTAPASDAPSYALKRGEDEQLQRAPSNVPRNADDDVSLLSYAGVNASLRESNTDKPSY